jgi:phosphoribosyl-ATP pyrophosphohydrolase
MSDPSGILARLMAVIEDRKAKRPAGSYTTKLFEGGVDAIGAKLCEEAAEVVDAATVAHEDRGYSVTYEAADLLYHFLVMLVQCGVPLIDVEEELGRRFGKSGLKDKDREPQPNAEASVHKSGL